MSRGWWRLLLVVIIILIVIIVIFWWYISITYAGLLINWHDCPKEEQSVEGEVLTDQELKLVNNTIKSQQVAGTVRHVNLAMSTIGTAAYIDSAAGGKDHYSELARLSNPVLRSNYHQLYQRLRLYLERELKAKCVLCRRSHR